MVQVHPQERQGDLWKGKYSTGLDVYCDELYNILHSIAVVFIINL